MGAASALQPTQPLAPKSANPLAGAAASPPIENVTVTADAPPKDRVAELMSKYDEMEGKTKAINEQTGALQPPKMDLPPPPQPKNTDPVQQWGSAAMAVAALGSLLTRTPLTTALNAAASTIKAFKANDQEAADTAFQQWKAASDLAVKQQNFQMEAYKSALAKASTDQKQAVAEFGAYAKAFGDETAYQAAMTRGVQGAQRIADEQKRNADNFYKNIGPVTEGYNFAKALRSPEFQAQLKTAKSPQEAAQMQAKLMGEVAPDLAQSSGVIDDSRLKTMAEQYLDGDTSVTSGLGYGKAGSATRVRLQNMIGEVAKERNMSGADIAAAKAEFAGLTAGERTLSTTQSRIGLGAAEIQKLEPQVTEASGLLKRSNYPSFNAVIQASQKETGSPELKNLAVRLQGLKSAFSQVLTRGGVPTDSARATTDELFNTKDPDRVMRAAMAAMNAETGAIEQAPGMVRQQLRAGLGGKSTAPSATSFRSAQDVKAAFGNGSITKEQAIEILKSKFGYGD